MQCTSIEACCITGSPLGKVSEALQPDRIELISSHPIPIGTYVAIPFKSKDIVTGNIIEWCGVGVVNETSYKKFLKVFPYAPAEESIGVRDEMLKFSLSHVSMMALVSIDRNKSFAVIIRVPNTPPPPETYVYLASEKILMELFGKKKESSIKIGHLLNNPNVEIYVDLNALTKHLFITGTTGSGKSNTVALLADRIASYGGTVIIYDVHGEYEQFSPLCNVIEYKINPLTIPPRILAKMIIPEAGANIQRKLLSRVLGRIQTAFKKIKDYRIITEFLDSREIDNDKIIKILRNSGLDFVNQMTLVNLKNMFESSELENVNEKTKLLYFLKEILFEGIRASVGKDGIDKKQVDKVCFKVEDFFEKGEKSMLSFDIIHMKDIIVPSNIIVLNVLAFDNEQKDYILSTILNELLSNAKSSYLGKFYQPVVVFIEEAHLFLSSDRSTSSKIFIERIAREGRKFGIMLGLVSQRPRNIDTNTLSQIQSFVFMKLVQQADKQAVMNASDILTEDLARSLSSMGPGEALLVGEWVGRFPVFVKIDKHEGKKLGASPDVASIWREKREKQEKEKIRREEDIVMISEASKDLVV